MSFRPMRRGRQELSREECEAVLGRGSAGVLAVAGDDGYPYAVPLSYAFDGDRLVFHCARSGHKLDAIVREPKASFCVVDQDEVHPEEYTSYFRSVIVFGTMHVIEDDDEKRAAAEVLGRRYAPEETEESLTAEIDKFWRQLTMLEMRIDHMTGKQAKELVPARS